MLQDQTSLRNQKRLTVLGRLAKSARLYWHNERGVTAIEFALVAAPFFYLMMGILEVSLMFVANVLLDHGVMEASRRIRTTELQTANGSAADFKKLICDATYAILDCGGSMFVDVKTYDDFQDVTNGSPVKNGAVDPSQLAFTPGGAGSIVVAKVYYEWPLFTPFFGAIWGDMGANKRLMQSAIAFRNEP